MEIYNSFQTSVKKALDEIDINWPKYKGLIICGTHSPKDWRKQIDKIKEIREARLPFLGICFGHQLAAIEYARNVLGIKTATSEELAKEGEFIVKKRPNLKVGLYPTIPTRLDSPRESYWNNYEVIDGFDDLWNKSENFITCQFHPEYQSSKDKPHPLLKQFLEYAKKESLS